MGGRERERERKGIGLGNLSEARLSESFWSEKEIEIIYTNIVIIIIVVPAICNPMTFFWHLFARVLLMSAWYACV